MSPNGAPLIRKIVDFFSEIDLDSWGGALLIFFITLIIIIAIGIVAIHEYALLRRQPESPSGAYQR
jgi:hypothetical protein